jgi:hypothetical protein
MRARQTIPWMRVFRYKYGLPPRPKNSGKCKCTLASQIIPPLRARHCTTLHCDTSRVCQLSSAFGPRYNPKSQSHLHRLEFPLWLFSASRGKQLSRSSLPRHTKSICSFCPPISGWGKAFVNSIYLFGWKHQKGYTSTAELYTFHRASSLVH